MAEPDVRPLVEAQDLARDRAAMDLAERHGMREVFGCARMYLGPPPAVAEHEVFGVLFLDAQGRVITYEEMFKGTLAQTSVYPREVVLRALHHQAAAVVLAHNHPSGTVQPSRADETLTQTLKTALALVDVRVLDHFIVANPHVYSFAEHGQI